MIFINNFYPAMLAVLIILASMISVKQGVPVYIVEILMGVIAGNPNLLQPEGWMIHMASAGI